MKLSAVFAFVFSILLSVSSWALDSRWDRLVSFAELKGQRQETFGGIYKTLTKKNDLDSAGSFHVDYFSAVGSENNQGEFRAWHLELVLESWVLSGDYWYIDQWLFKVAKDSQNVMVKHYRLVQDSNKNIVNQVGLPVSPSEGQTQLDGNLESWYQTLGF